MSPNGLEVLAGRSARLGLGREIGGGVVRVGWLGGLGGLGWLGGVM